MTSSRYSMVDVGGKTVTRRRALACGRIVLGERAFPLVRDGELAKGDALGLAEVAGVMAAKRTADLVPLCHPLGLDQARVGFTFDEGRTALNVYCEVVTSARTGVEMEALTGVQVALLTVWDVSKPVEAALAIEGVRLLRKEGGKSGVWLHPDGLPELPEGFE